MIYTGWQALSPLPALCIIAVQDRRGGGEARRIRLGFMRGGDGGREGGSESVSEQRGGGSEGVREGASERASESET